MGPPPSTSCLHRRCCCRPTQCLRSVHKTHIRTYTHIQRERESLSTRFNNNKVIIDKKVLILVSAPHTSIILISLVEEEIQSAVVESECIYIIPVILVVLFRNLFLIVNDD